MRGELLATELDGLADCEDAGIDETRLPAFVLAIGLSRVGAGPVLSGAGAEPRARR